MIEPKIYYEMKYIYIHNIKCKLNSYASDQVSFQDFSLKFLSGTGGK